MLRDQNFANTHWDLAWTYLGKGMYRESVASYQKAFELDPDPVTKGYLAISYAKLGQRDEVLKQLEWLKQESPRRYVPSFAFKLAYIALGQKDEAFTRLEKEMVERSMPALWPHLSIIKSFELGSARCKAVADSGEQTMSSSPTTISVGAAQSRATRDRISPRRFTQRSAIQSDAETNESAGMTMAPL